MLLTTVAATSRFFKRDLLVATSRVHPNPAPPQRTHRVVGFFFVVVVTNYEAVSQGAGKSNVIFLQVTWNLYLPICSIRIPHFHTCHLLS